MFAGWTFKEVLALTLPLGLSIAAFGSAAALGKAVSAVIESIARQPEAAPKMMLPMFVGFAMIEALTIYALVVIFILGGKIG